MKDYIFGKMSLFEHMLRSAAVRAAGEAFILSMDKKGFFAIVSKGPSPVFNILEGMSKRIMSLSKELEQYKKGRQLIY